jgi:putative peptide maturation dehydrogenase
LIQRARRAAHVFFRLSDDLVPDIARLLAGEVELERRTQLLALSVLTGRERPVSPDEYRVIEAARSDRWTAAEDLPADDAMLEELALEGLLVADVAEGTLGDLRRRDEALARTGWEPYAALYHALTKWRDVDVGPLFEAPPETLRRPDSPPGHFHTAPAAVETVDLPLVERDETLFRTLMQRKTTRGFDEGSALSLDELAVVLRYTFGPHGLARMAEDVVLVRKTSPSGGSLHPVEAYPLVLGVDGVEPGLYHYRADRHALELLESVGPNRGRELLVQFVAGQHYLAAAQVVVVLTARFARSFWKYRSNSRAYAVVLMDAAHLSQTFYLVCTALGLGAYFSAAVNGANIEDRLGLDGIEEGAIAVLGCGRPASGRAQFDLDFEPYVPRTTQL